MGMVVEDGARLMVVERRERPVWPWVAIVVALAVIRRIVLGRLA